MPVPNQFANVTTSIPLSQLDANFNTPITLGNTAIQLGNTVTTLNNMTLANVTVTSGNVTITNVTVTTANVTTANIANVIVTGTGTFAAGSNTAPSITFTGDTNTGIYSPGADQVAIATGGTAAIYANSSQNVGVNTTSPLTRMHVQVSALSGYTAVANSGLLIERGNGPAALNIASPNTESGFIWFADQDSTSVGNIAYNHPSNFMSFQTNGAERARFNDTGAFVLAGGTTTANGIGITFPATQSASSNANTLDDYEEGTWTPSVGGTATYFSQTGKYTKIGNMVSIYCLMRINAIGTGSTTTISGLPFTAAQRGGGGMTYWAALSQAVDFLYPNADSTGLNFLGGTAATANPTDGIAIFQNSAYVIFSATYFV